jgi:transposase
MIPAHVRIFVCTEPIDFRRGFDGLALAARERLGEDPRAGGLFVFTNRRATGVKIVWLERTGCCLLYKRLHQARVVLPAGDGPGIRIDGTQLGRLLAGVPRATRRPGATR